MTTYEIMQANVDATDKRRTDQRKAARKAAKGQKDEKAKA